MAESVVGLVLKAQNQASPELLKVTQQISQLGKNALTVTDSTKRFAGNLGALGGVAMGAFRSLQSVQIAVYSLTSGFQQAQHDAINLNEAMARSRRLFGEASADVEKFASVSAESFGIASGDALKYAATFGNILIGMRVAPSQAADMSKALVALSADLRVFNQDISQEELLNRIKSALTGNNKSLREFGVTLSESSVKAKAMEMGLISNEKQMTASIKAQARYALIVEQTAVVQGAFAESGGSIVVSQAKMQAKLQEASQQLGVALMPILRKVQEVMLMMAQAGRAIADVISQHMNVAFAALAIILTRVALGIRINNTALRELIIGKVAAARATVAETAALSGSHVPTMISTLLTKGLASAVRSLWAALGPIGWAIIAVTLAMEAFGVAGSDFKDNMGQAELASMEAGAGILDTADVIAEGEVDMEKAAKNFFGPIGDQATINLDMATTNVKNGVRGLIEGFRGNRNDIRSAVDQLKADLKDAMNPKKEIAQLEKEMNSDLLKRALKSNDPIVRAQAEYTKKIMEQRIAILKDPSIMNQALATGQTIDQVLEDRAAQAALDAKNETQQRQEEEMKTAIELAFRRGEKDGQAYVAGWHNGAAVVTTPVGLEMLTDPEARRGEIQSYGRVLTSEERLAMNQNAGVVAAVGQAAGSDNYAAAIERAMQSGGFGISAPAIPTTTGVGVVPPAWASNLNTGTTNVTINQTFAPGSVANKDYINQVGNQVIKSLNTSGVRTRTGGQIPPIAQ